MSEANTTEETHWHGKSGCRWMGGGQEGEVRRVGRGVEQLYRRRLSPILMDPVLRHWPGRGRALGLSLARLSNGLRVIGASSLPASPARRALAPSPRCPRQTPVLAPLTLTTTSNTARAPSVSTHGASVHTSDSQRPQRPRLPASSPHFSQPSLLVGRKSCQRRTRGHRTIATFA